MNILRMFLLILPLALSMPTWAQTLLEFPYRFGIGQEQFEIPVTLVIEADQQSSAKQVVAEFTLTAFLADIDRAIRAAGLDDVPGTYQSESYNGTGAQVIGESLWLKYHFRIDPKGGPATNGSLTIYLLPLITDGTLGLSPQSVDLRISNTAYSVIGEFSGLKSGLESKLLSEARQGLGRPENQARVPASILGMTVSLTSSTFERRGDHDILRLEAELQ